MWVLKILCVTVKELDVLADFGDGYLMERRKISVLDPGGREDPFALPYGESHKGFAGASLYRIRRPYDFLGGNRNGKRIHH